MTIYLNGEYIRQGQAKGNTPDEYCDVSFTGGVFETMRAYSGRIFKLSEHIKRLFMSAKFLGMSISYTSEKLEEICCKVLEDTGLKDAQVRISIRDKTWNEECSIQTQNSTSSDETLMSLRDTKKDGNLGLRNSPNSEFRTPNSSFSDEDLLIIVKPLPQISSEKGVIIITSSIIKQPPLPQAKSSNFLSGVLARAEAYVNNPFEIVFLNRHGYVTEGTVSNIFIVKDGIVITPPVYLGLLNGISRQCVLEIAMQTGIKTMHMPFTRYDIFTADEVFLTNSIIEILPVSVVDGRRIENRRKNIPQSLLMNEEWDNGLASPYLGMMDNAGGIITRILQEGYRHKVKSEDISL